MSGIWFSSCTKQQEPTPVTPIKKDTVPNNNNNPPPLILGKASFYIYANSGDIWYQGFYLTIDDTLNYNWAIHYSTPQIQSCGDPLVCEEPLPEGLHHFKLKAISNSNIKWDTSFAVAENVCHIIALKNQHN